MSANDPFARLSGLNDGFQPLARGQIDLTQDDDDYKSPMPPPDLKVRPRPDSPLSQRLPVSNKKSKTKPSAAPRTQTRRVETKGVYEIQLQALRAFDLDLRALSTQQQQQHTQTDSLDWTLIMYNVDSKQAIDWNELVLHSVLVNQFAVARAWSEVQLMHNSTVDLAMMLYGDETRSVFIQLVQSFAQDVLVCGGVKYMSVFSIRSVNARRQENCIYFSSFRNALTRGSHLDVPAFSFDEEPDRISSPGFLELSQRTYRSRRYLFSKMVASACNRKWLLPERPENYDMRFLLPADLYMHVQTACHSIVARRRRADYVDLLSQILDNAEIWMLVMLAHIASLELAQSLVIRGQNMKPHILDRITILRNFAVDQIVREL